MTFINAEYSPKKSSEEINLHKEDLEDVHRRLEKVEKGLELRIDKIADQLSEVNKKL